jgi:ribonuclease J
VQFFKSRQAFEIKDVVVKPFLCDHSAYDSYMIALYQGDEKVLYTGDFRANGRKNFESLLKSLPKKVDLLICEGTLSSERNQTEQELEEKMVETFKKYKHVFILKSSQNFDRDVTIYRAAKRTGKTYIQHLSTANVAKELGNIPNPISFDDCYTYLPRAVSESKHKKIKETYKDKLLSRSQITKMDNFVMQITSSMKGYLKKVKDEGRWFDSVAIFSMWEGYKREMYDVLSLFSEMHDLDYSNRQSTALMFMSGDKFTMFERPMSQMKNDGLNVIDLHTSGHADKQSIKKLMYSVSPKEIIYVHTNKKGENVDGL